MSRRLPFAVALALALATAVPAAMASPGNGPPVHVAISGSPAALAEVRDHPGFQKAFDWPEIGWLGGTVGQATYAELKARGDLVVEDDPQWKPLCHKGGNDPKGCDPPPPGEDPPEEGTDRKATPSHQVPYGIKQIYNDAALSATSGGAGVVLGHIDTGIDTSHVDLVNRIVYADTEDRNGHGTHTAGTAAADAGSDGLGIYGVAPEASIRSYGVCKAWCNTNQIVAAIQDCMGKCDVITFSIGGDGESKATRDALNAYVANGGLFIAAAGNDGPSLGSIDYPAANPNAVAVAALDASKQVADFSSRGIAGNDCTIGTGEVELAAAGVSVLSTYKNDGYATMSGTSMATPHVAGLALKKWTGDGATTRSALHTGVEDITLGKSAGVGCDPASGHGLPHT